MHEADVGERTCFGARHHLLWTPSPSPSPGSTSMSNRFRIVAGRAKAGLGMRGRHIAPRIGLAVLVLTPLLVLASMAGSATASPVQYCAQIPIVGGIPPWGFHSGAPITGATGSYARGHGDINLAANTV